MIGTDQPIKQRYNSMAATTVQPALFVSHGAPTLALEDSLSSRFLEQLGAQLQRPRAIVVISAHWESRQVMLDADPAPKTIHDFGGFPRALYAIEYPARIDLAVSAEVADLLQEAGQDVQWVTGRGLDHGAWTPLMRMYPQADVPLVNLSLPTSLGEAGLRALGRALRSLRQSNVLILASGGYTHNLWEMQPDGSPPAPWATAFSSWVGDRLEARQDQQLDHWLQDAPHARTNHPSVEHFLPLFVALGAASDGVAAVKIHDDWRYGSLSMACWRFD
jgi:4,5-DOPA dioxygenase extradiol